MASTRPNQTISNFKTAMAGGGARPNLFEVEITTLTRRNCLGFFKL